MNPYEVLGVSSDSDADQIKTAYRKLAMQHHPDRNGGSEEASAKFQQIQDAYDMLRSDKPRSPQNEQQQHQHFHDIHDMFNHFFHRQQMSNPNLQAMCEITLEQAFHGCSLTFDINGKSIIVQIPAGIDQHQTVRVPGAGGQQNPNFPPGDLHVTVRLRPHDRFHRAGMTLQCGVEIDLLDLLTGRNIDVFTITGEKKIISVPENSNPNTTVTIAGEGMPVVNSDGRGDLIVHFAVKYPTFTKKQLAALRKLKKG